MNINTKSLNYSLLLTVIFLVALAAIFSYGYMGYKANVINNDTLSGEVLKPENILSITGDTNFALNITLDELSIVEANNNLSDFIEDNENVTINISVEPEKYKNAVTCDYVFYYEPTTEYKPSPGAESLTELGFSGNCTGCVAPKNTFGPVSIANKTQGTKEQLYEGSITTDPATGKATQTWQFHYRFYNLEIDQSSVIGKNPSGKIIIEGKNCYAAKNS